MIRRDDREHVAVLTMEHGKVNALDLELLQDLRQALRAAERSTAGAVVLTGMGSSFSAGVDLWRILDGGAAYISRFLPLLTDCLRALFTFPRPVVAAVNGHAIAGGCILALACDRRVMAEGRGRIGIPELQVGVPFPVIALEIVRAATSESMVAELALVGGTYSTSEALRRGLVHAVVEPDTLLERACEVAEGLASIPPAAFGIVKRELRHPALERFERLAPTVDPEVIEVWSRPSSAEAIRAYLERTLPKRG